MNTVRTPRRPCSVQYFESKQFIELCGIPVTRAIRDVFRSMSVGAEHSRSYIGGPFSSDQVLATATKHAARYLERIVIVAAPVIYWGKTNAPKMLHSNSRIDRLQSTIDLGLVGGRLSIPHSAALLFCFVPEVIPLRKLELKRCLPSSGCSALVVVPVPVLKKSPSVTSSGESLIRALRALGQNLKCQSHLYGGPVVSVACESMRETTHTWSPAKTSCLILESPKWNRQRPLPDVIEDRVPIDLRADYFHRVEECREEAVEELAAAASKVSNPAERTRYAELIRHIALRTQDFEIRQTLNRRALAILDGNKSDLTEYGARQRASVVTCVDIEFCEIPEGLATIGSNVPFESAHSPQHQIFIKTFRISKFPVLNRDFKLFLHSVGREQYTSTYTSDDCPAQYVSWYDAKEFCCWLQMKWRTEGRIGPKYVVRLPSEVEWERACRGDDDRTYPWGVSLPSMHNCNWIGAGHFGVTPALAKSPSGDSPFGVSDMCGNVYEWSSSLWGESASQPDFRYPYVASDGREDLNAHSMVRRVIRGGAYFFRDDCVTTFTRNGKLPTSRERGGGFRIVLAKP